MYIDSVFTRIKFLSLVYKYTKCTFIADWNDSAHNKYYNLISFIVIVYYIGSGRRGTGDWCFEDGFITFRDIAQLYLSHLQHRVLTIVSDCSYSGCWVRNCMEFLDEQGVQPCGHKAKEKGVLIKVYASCGPTQIPTQHQFSVNGASMTRIRVTCSHIRQRNSWIHSTRIA